MTQTTPNHRRYENYRQQCVELGLCYSCGRRTDGSFRCLDCRTKINKSRQASPETRRRQSRLELQPEQRHKDHEEMTITFTTSTRVEMDVSYIETLTIEETFGPQGRVRVVTKLSAEEVDRLLAALNDHITLTNGRAQLAVRRKRELTK